jgi:hypothetical protein
MKNNSLFILLILFAFACTNEPQMYIFREKYCTEIVVGGVVGIENKCYVIGDTIYGKKTITGKIKSRLRPHFTIDDELPSNISSQEFIEIPIKYFK